MSQLTPVGIDYSIWNGVLVFVLNISVMSRLYSGDFNVSAEALAPKPNRFKPSTCTVLTTKLGILHSKFLAIHEFEWQLWTSWCLSIWPLWSHEISWHIWLLTHRNLVTHICVCKLGQVQIMACRLFATKQLPERFRNVSEISIEIPMSSSEKMRLKMSSAKRRSFCFGSNVTKDNQPL